MSRFAIAAGSVLVLVMPVTGWAQKEKFDPFGVDVPLPDAVQSLLDADGDGQIDDEEATTAEANFLKLPRTRQPLGQEIRKALDANGDRKVDEDEAKQGVARGKAHHRGVANEVAEIVKRLDTDGDQKISAQEFRGLMQQFGVLGVLLGPRIGEFFNRMDVNRNGEISLVEAQRGAEYLQEQIKLAEEERRRKALMQDPFYQQAQRALTMLDKNKDQLISKTEARKNKPVNDAFLAADTNLDQHLSVDECHEYLKKQADPQQKAGDQPKIEFLPKGELEAPKKRRAK